MTRMTAEERRDHVVEAAVVEFAAGGYAGTSTEAIAERAGVSQPYLFRLFGTKRDLFLAVCESACSRIVETFESSLDRYPDLDEPLDKMGRAYTEMIEDRDVLRCQLHGFAASEDPVIRERMRDGFAEILDTIGRLSGASHGEVLAFVAKGMLVNVMRAIEDPARALGSPEEAFARLLAAAPARTGGE